MSSEGLLARAQERTLKAYGIINRLRLLERWSTVGRPVVVGSVALGLVVEQDIDLEIRTTAPSIEAGFRIVCDCALVPGVKRARFRNELYARDPTLPEGLYWKLEYLAERDEWWQIDMWVLDERVTGTRVGEHVIDSLRARLTNESREVILGIKEEAVSRGLRIPGYHVYQAVLDHGSATLDEFLRWYERASSAT